MANSPTTQVPLEVQHLADRAATARNMVEVDSLLHAAWQLYAGQFSRNVLSPSRCTLKQADWIREVNTYYQKDLMQAANTIFQSIPSRMHTTAMYRSLAKRLSTQVYA